MSEIQRIDLLRRIAKFADEMDRVCARVSLMAEEVNPPADGVPAHRDDC